MIHMCELLKPFLITIFSKKAKQKMKNENRRRKKKQYKIQKENLKRKKLVYKIFWRNIPSYMYQQSRIMKSR